MLIGIGFEFVLGVACLLLIPVGRPDGWLPPQEKAVYVAHASLGTILGAGGLFTLFVAQHSGRIVRMGTQIGSAGLLLGASGGILAAFHPWRLTGIVLMLAGTFTALLGFFVPLLDQIPREEFE